MKNGFLTSEFFSQAFGPYGVAFALIYMALGDADTMELIKQAASVLPAPAQALVALAVKGLSIVGATIVGKAGASTTASYNAGRVQQKLAEIKKAEAK